MKTNRYVLAATLLAIGIGGSVPALAEAHTHAAKVYTIRDEASRLLKDVEERAYNLNDHAVTLQAAHAVRLDREWYLTEISAVREDVNTMGTMIARLQALESFETSPDKKVVEQARPRLAGIAKTTDAIIRYLNDRGTQLELPAFHDMTTTLQRQTGELWTMLHDSVRLGDLKIREEQLKRQLSDVPKAPSDTAPR